MGTDTQTDRQTYGHRDSMKEPAKGRFFENIFVEEPIFSYNLCKVLQCLYSFIGFHRDYWMALAVDNVGGKSCHFRHHVRQLHNICTHT